MNNPDHISESLKTIFWVKILKFFDADPGYGIFLTLDQGSGMEKIRIRDKHPGSATLLNSHFFTFLMPIADPDPSQKPKTTPS